ncbi:MAG TPA: hypothetical protein PKM84_01350 [Candidatus Pacearchaeota archaeon]|nr:hypothetical protein [Candidatus Pacearchaeota archaeon]
MKKYLLALSLLLILGSGGAAKASFQQFTASMSDTQKDEFIGILMEELRTAKEKLETALHPKKVLGAAIGPDNCKSNGEKINIFAKEQCCNGSTLSYDLFNGLICKGAPKQAVNTAQYEMPTPGSGIFSLVSASISKKAAVAGQPEIAESAIVISVNAPVNKEIMINSFNGFSSTLESVANVDVSKTKIFVEGAGVAKQGAFYVIKPGETKNFRIYSVIYPKQGGFFMHKIKSISWKENDYSGATAKEKILQGNDLADYKTGNIYLSASLSQLQAQAAVKGDIINSVATLEPDSVTARTARLRGNVDGLKSGDFLSVGFFVERKGSQYAYAGQTNFGAYTPMNLQAYKGQYTYLFQSLLPQSQYCYKAYGVESTGKKVWGKEKCFYTDIESAEQDFLQQIP